jgi:hypothetical protein
MPKSRPKESKRTSRWVDLDDYDHTTKPGEFLEVTEWSNGEGFDLHISRSEQTISLTWGEFSALQAALGDWIDQPKEEGDICPHIYTSDEGTSYCKLAVQTADLLAKLSS